MKEGYLQLKIGELKEELIKIEKKIDEEKNGLNNFYKRFENDLRKEIEFIKPFLDMRNEIIEMQKKINKNIENTINIFIEKEFLEYKNFINSNVMKFEKNMRNQIMFDFVNLQKHQEKEINMINKKINSMIILLNKKLNSNIQVVKIKEEDDTNGDNKHT